MLVATAVLLAACWTAVPAGAATLNLDVTPTVTDTPNDGVVGPGDQLTITLKVTNNGTTAASPDGTLTSSTTGVTVTQGTSAYPGIAPGTSAANDTPFKVTVDKSLVCGTTLNFKLSLTDGTDTANVPFTIDTGAPSTTPQSYSGSPASVGSVGTQLRPRLAAEGTADVATPGIIKAVEVNVGQLQHDNIGHLTLTLVAPDGRAVPLVNGRGGPAPDDFTNTTFTETGAAFSDSDLHHTGAFQVAALTVFRNMNQAGRWRLDIDQTDPGEHGRLASWTLKIKSADCSPHSFVDLKVPPRVDPNATVALDASGSRSATNSIKQYEWDYGDGHFVTGTSTVSHSFGYGPHTVKVRVTDDGGVIDTVSKTFMASFAPTATIATVVGAKQEKDVELDGSASSDVESPTLTKYEWDLDNNGTFTDATGSRPVVRFHTSGTHTINLRVTDGDGATGVDSKTFDVAPTFAPTPVVAATPNPVAAGALVSFDASGSTDDGTIVAYDWDLDGNGTFETTGTSPTAGRSYPNAGVVSVGLKLTDDDGRFTVTHIAVLVRGAGGGSGPGSPGATPGGRTPTGGTGAAGGAEGGIAGGPAQGALAASLAGSPIQKLKLITKTGLSLSCRADRAATCSVTATLPAAKARSLGLSKSRKKAFVLGRASVRLRKAGTATITVRVSKRTLGRLRHVSRVSVLVTGKAADSGGGRAVLRRVVLLRR